MRHRGVKGKEAVFAECAEFLVTDPAALKGRWAERFGNAAPLRIEIGSGKGQFICAQAELHPDVNFIACEGLPDVYVRILEKIRDRGLRNVRVIGAWITDPCECFADGEADAVFINFCDPWPKARHEKRRLTNRRLLASYVKIMGGSGTVAFKTDNDDLFEWSLGEIQACGLKVLELSRDLENSPYAKNNVMTEYEEKFASSGKTINYVKAEADGGAEKLAVMQPAEGDIAAVERLARVTRVLRAPGGCPWDREQTYDSLRKPMIEEAYEAVAAVENGDMENFREELGDVLLQVLMNSDIAKERGDFTLADVANEEAEKMIRRHPHVFAKPDASIDTEGVLKRWDEIKAVEHKSKTQTEAMEGIPRALPALWRADKIQAKAAKVGFDWNDVSGAYDKVAEECAEVKEAAAAGSAEKIRDEVGDLLFAAVNVARMLGVDPEDALNHTSEKFMRRFAYVEKTAGEAGRRLPDMTLAEMDALWEEAKAKGL
ncbi:MAG: nucleoside triphosphate pyrophosphohydrolase [Firmicutes bacterium]|nr:nucleoside triphosphate pyrophosphohydrolase [Bacillota bacterium]